MTIPFGWYKISTTAQRQAKHKTRQATQGAGEKGVLGMENFTPEQIKLIKDYLTAEIALDKHLEGAKRGYNPKFTDAVKQASGALKGKFPPDEVSFITSAAYRPDLIKAFLV